MLNDLTKFFGLLVALSLLTAGLVVGLVTNQWLLAPMGLILTGAIVIIFAIPKEKKNSDKFWQTRVIEALINGTTVTISILVIFALINFMAIRHGVRFDLTENKLFTIAPQSQEIVKNLTQSLKIWVFDPNIDQELKTLLEDYTRYSDKLEFEFVDPQIEIGLAEQFKVQSFGEVYLEYGDKREKISTTSNDFAGNISEIAITNAIFRIQNERIFRIDFLQGHGEPTLEAGEGGFTQAVDQLQDRGYLVRELNLITQRQIPNNTDLIIISRPIRKFLLPEITLLQTYLKNGGRLLIMLMPNVNSGLEPILQDWGVTLDNRFIIDASGVGKTWGFGPGVVIITNYGNHPITKTFGSGISVFPESRPVKMTEKLNINGEPFIITDSNTWAENNLAPEEIVFNPKQDIRGPLNIAVALNRKDTSKQLESRLVVFGNGMFATDGWFQKQLNSDIFLNTVNWLIGDDSLTLSIRPKEQTNRRINLTPLEAGIISWMALRIMPILSFIVAGFMWWRKR